MTEQGFANAALKRNGHERKVRLHPASPVEPWPRSNDCLGDGTLDTAIALNEKVPEADDIVMTAKTGKIHIGIGGWTFERWRGEFYPKGLPHAKELAYASERLTSIEINGTFYRTQTPATFRKWGNDVPDGFVFSVKGPRYATNRTVLKEAGDSIKRFLDSGVTELGPHLGPLLWQFAPTKKFDEADFGGFLELLPGTFNGSHIRHVVEVRHDSFKTPAFAALLRKFSIPPVYTDHKRYPNIADVTGDFVYARLQQGDDDIPTAYPPKAITQWSKRLSEWAAGGEPDDLERIEPPAKGKSKPRDVYAYVIHEGKIRAPAGAMALIEKVGKDVV
jgi:uncharacterized protein YecE (DUF72 family)